MFKKSFIGIGISCAVATMVFAQAQNCGDGNQWFDPIKHEDVVRYFASINEFDIVRESDDKIVITDTVECRYGRDVLIGVETIEFLDKEVDIEELEIHENTKDLSVDVLRTILLAKLMDQVRGLGVDPSKATAQSVGSSNPGQSTGSTETVQAEGLTSSELAIRDSGAATLLTSDFATSPSNTFSTTGGQSAGAAPYYPAPYYPSYSYGGFNQPTGQYYDPYYSGGSFNSSTGHVSSNGSGATVIATWSLSSVATNDLVYFDAIDSSGEHYYLGSSLGYAGSKTLTLPSDLLDESEITVHIKTGDQVIKTFVVSL